MSTPPAADLDDHELAQLIERVFRPTDDDRRLAFLVDLPDTELADSDRWRDRRALAVDWWQRLASFGDELGLEVDLFFYRNARRNNADLPASAWQHRAGPPPADADDLDPSAARPLVAVFEQYDLLIAATQLSATAPLKLAAPTHGFRAATMPGFSRAMVPALRLDYGEVDRRVRLLKSHLDAAAGADFVFMTDAGASHLHLDLRHRQAHASGGLLTTPGMAGNLPSGETYIVPYEGERGGDPSRSHGRLPVELDGEVVIYRIAENRAVAVDGDGDGDGDVARREAALLAREPAYGNLAELGLGVLADLGVEPIGEILLDEKLGLHIAFGRSDHFGGQVGASDFSRPEAVVHIDRVYLPQTQPRVRVRSVDLDLGPGQSLALIRDDRYVIDFTHGGGDA